MNPVAALIAMGVTVLVTFVAGGLAGGARRTTGDFYVANRTVSPLMNASAIGGEYISAASFFGVAALILSDGANMLWFPVGYTFGYLLLLLFVAAPLRRSGAYTVSDFAEFRFGRRGPRLVVSVISVLIGWLYVLPQFQAAGSLVAYLTGWPRAVGSFMVAALVLVVASNAGMRSVTFTQAVQFWLKLTALAVPLAFMGIAWWGGVRSEPPSPSLAGVPMEVGLSSPSSLFDTYSLLIALIFGAVGLPHVLVRFYTNPTGTAARRTTLLVLALLGAFYVLPVAYGALGRVVAPDLAARGNEAAVVLELPGRVLGPGWLADVLSAFTAAGAFAAFVSASSGLVVCVAGVLCQDVVARWTEHRTALAFRLALVPALVVPLAFSFILPHLQVARMVGLAFAVAASTLCPLLVLGIWWTRLTRKGALAGLTVGGIASGGAAAANLVAALDVPSWLQQPAAWTCPLAFATMVLVSLATRPEPAARVATVMESLHVPLDAQSRVRSLPR
ncbi:cation acetate symporter [Micrococcales bacterium 31B]|nr:cation acetate symporter [Micrococcales bacterium 31B]